MERIEEVLAQAAKMNVHPVCLLCKRPCKKHYSFWSFQMPPEEYCDRFLPREKG